MRAAVLALAALLSPSLITWGFSKIWTDGTFGIPHPAPSFAALLALALAVGFWMAAALRFRRFAAALGGSLLFLLAVALNLGLLAALAREPCGRCEAAYPTCCEAWGPLLLAAPTLALLTAAGTTGLRLLLPRLRRGPSPRALSD